MLSLSRMEHTVLTGNLKTLDVRKTTDGTTLIVEVQHHLVILDVHFLERRTLADDGTHAVGFVQCQESQTLTNLLFLGGMYLRDFIGIDTVVGADQSAIGNYL